MHVPLTADCSACTQLPLKPVSVQAASAWLGLGAGLLGPVREYRQCGVLGSEGAWAGEVGRTAVGKETEVLDAHARVSAALYLTVWEE